MAIESEWIRADMVEVSEFPYLIAKYQVMGVPLTVVNETTFIEGARPEPAFVDEVLSVLTSSSESTAGEQ
jgi:predicted DsbA family dithiol-disulfide isomerase